MKTTLFIIGFAALTTACGMIDRPSKSQAGATAVSVVLDVSDPRLYWPMSDDVLQQFRFDQRPEAACRLRLRTITDRRHTPIVTLRLADGATMQKDNRNFDPRYRNRNIKAYYAAVKSSIDDFYARIDTGGVLKNSECYYTICDELTFLSKDSSDERTLIAGTDLREKSDLYDCYRNPNFDAKELAEHFNKSYPLPQNLEGITVIFLFNPRSRAEDIQYSNMLEVYRFLLEPRRATIEIRANL